MGQKSKTVRGAQLLASVAVVAGLYGYGFRLARVQGHSMEPTFHADQWLLVRRLNWPAPPLRKGEVIVFEQDRDWLVKRIAALPGEPFPASMEEIEMPDEPPSGQDRTPVRGGQSAEAVDASAPAKDCVPSGSLFVLGDNLNNSEDSRTFGPIPMTSVLGRVIHWTRPPKRRLGADRAPTGREP